MSQEGQGLHSGQHGKLPMLETVRGFPGQIDLGVNPGYDVCHKVTRNLPYLNLDFPHM